MTSWTRVENAPFLLLIFFSMLGWALKHFVDRTIESPIIEYSVSTKNEDTLLKSTFRIHNISRSTKFNNIKFVIRCKGTVDDSLIWVTPYFPPPFNIDAKENSTEIKVPKYYSLTLNGFQPYVDFELVVLKTGNNVPELRVTSSDAVRLMKKGITTCIIKNENWIILTLAGILVILIIIYFKYIKLS